MTPEAQRIAIAEACGWTRVGENSWSPPDKPWGGWPATSLPDYLTDLNAMHEAEKVLTERELHDYARELSIVCMGSATHVGLTMTIFRATAAQRAEAFLRTLNLWKP